MKIPVSFAGTLRVNVFSLETNNPLDTGLVRKSSAPESNALTTVPGLSSAVRIRMGIELNLRTAAHTCQPSIPFIIRSRMITSGDSLRTFRTPSSPLLLKITSNPRVLSKRERRSVMSGSSSITNTFVSIKISDFVYVLSPNRRIINFANGLQFNFDSGDGNILPITYLKIENTKLI